MARTGAITLTDVLEPVLTIVCEPCARRGFYSVRRLLNKHGDARLPDILTYLSRECPKQGNPHSATQCKARFEFSNGSPAPTGAR
jgi:hypothetical protein